MPYSRLGPLVLAALAAPALKAAHFNATGVEQGLFAGFERYLSPSRFPLRALHPSAEFSYAQVSDSRGSAYADTKEFKGRVTDMSDNGHLGFFLDASYGGSRFDVRTSNAPIAASPLDTLGLGGGVLLELPVMARVGFYGEYGYYSFKMSYSRPTGTSLIPEKDAFSQIRYGVRFFPTDSDALGVGGVSGRPDYLPAFQSEYSWRHLLGGRSSLVLAYQAGLGVKSWQLGFGLGF